MAIVVINSLTRSSSREGVGWLVLDVFIRKCLSLQFCGMVQKWYTLKKMIVESLKIALDIIKTKVVVIIWTFVSIWLVIILISRTLPPKKLDICSFSLNSFISMQNDSVYKLIGLLALDKDECSGNASGLKLCHITWLLRVH